VLRRVVAALAVIVWAVSASAEPAPPVPFVVAYEDTELPPYYLGVTTEVPEKPGINVEMLQILGAQMQEIVVEFKRMPWKRCLHELEMGVVDAAFPASFKEKRTRMGAYPMAGDSPDINKSMVELSYYLYTLRGSGVGFEGGRIAGLGDAPIGAPLGYSIVDDLRAMGYEVEAYGATLTNLQKLIGGRLPAIAAQGITVEAITARDPERFADVVRIDPPLRSKHNYLMISHQFLVRHPGLAEEIWERLAEIRRTQLADIARKYTPGS
jgi:polar amino acid transport system substrate-binding protein